MALSRRAQMHADEIRRHDWSDAPYRADRAGHSRDDDTRTGPQSPSLSDPEADSVRLNVMWVTAQVLTYDDPNFDVYEFAEACGINTRTRKGQKNHGIAYGLRRSTDGRPCVPGTADPDELFAPIHLQRAGRDVTGLTHKLTELGAWVVLVGWGNAYSMVIVHMPKTVEGAVRARTVVREWQQQTAH